MDEVSNTTNHPRLCRVGRILTSGLAFDERVISLDVTRLESRGNPSKHYEIIINHETAFEQSFK